MSDEPLLLGPSDIRRLAARYCARPTKTLGQNFLLDANTIRRIVATARLGPDDIALEVGPGLGSLTLGLLGARVPVTAVEIDPTLADALAVTVGERAPAQAAALRVVVADALRLTSLPGAPPTALVANLPYNVAVPVVLHLLALLPSLRSGLVMVQAEVAARLAAAPGSKVYGVPSAKLAWYAHAQLAGSISRSVFWPAPNVDSGLVRFVGRPAPEDGGVGRPAVFRVVDAAFAQRRKMLRSALAGWAGSTDRAEQLLRAADVDPTARGETLSIEQFAQIAAAAAQA